MITRVVVAIMRTRRRIVSSSEWGHLRQPLPTATKLGNCFGWRPSDQPLSMAFAFSCF